ncbi:hypothetical protein Tco_0775244, partial [Tanacetum coccineum]
AMIYDVCIAWSMCGFILMRTIPSGWICVLSGVARVSTSRHTGCDGEIGKESEVFGVKTAELARVQEELKRKRQEDVINSAKYYNDDDWSDIMGQVHANKGLTADLLGPDVNEDNFAARMAATLKYVKTFTDDQLKAEFDKIRNAAANLQAQNLRRSLKRLGVDVEQPRSKKSKSSAALQTPVPAATHQSSAGVTPDVHQSPFVDTPPHSPKVSSHPDVTPCWEL